jgi:hypothetical protein
MQRHHFHIARHVARVGNATYAYRTKHGIVDTNVV